MYIMDNSTTEVYISQNNVFTYLPIVGYDGKAPIVSFNGHAIRCQYSRQKIQGAYKLNPYNNTMYGVPERKNFWYI